MLNSLHGQIPRLKVESIERGYAEHKKCFRQCLKVFDSGTLSQDEKACVIGCLSKYRDSERYLSEKNMPLRTQKLVHSMMEILTNRKLTADSSVFCFLINNGEDWFEKLQFIMFLPDNPFDEAMLQAQLQAKNKDGGLFCPWTEEVQNYRKVLANSFSQRKSNYGRKYTSQFDSYTEKSRELKKTPVQRKSILIQKAVTIEYETNPKNYFKNKDESATIAIKLPMLPSKKGTPQTPKKMQFPSNEQYQGSTKNSKKSYVSKIRTQGPPHLQIYRRSLVAARQLFPSSSPNPQRNSDKYYNK